MSLLTQLRHSTTHVAPCYAPVSRHPKTKSRRNDVKCNLRDGAGDMPPRLQERLYPRRQRLPVLTLVASCVQINSDLARFEQVAGRTAMIAFAVALVLEPALPYGVFSTWGPNGLAIYLSSSALLIFSAAVVATKSRRSFGGLKIQRAVLSCITAFTRLASSNLQKSVDHALDVVFEQVFGSSFVDANLIELDDYIA